MPITSPVGEAIEVHPLAYHLNGAKGACPVLPQGKYANAWDLYLQGPSGKKIVDAFL